MSELSATLLGHFPGHFSDTFLFGAAGALYGAGCNNELDFDEKILMYAYFMSASGTWLADPTLCGQIAARQAEVRSQEAILRQRDRERAEAIAAARRRRHADLVVDDDACDQ